MRNLELSDAVIQLHQIARVVEQELGNGAISQEIRLIADKLHNHVVTESADQ